MNWLFQVESGSRYLVTDADDDPTLRFSSGTKVPAAAIDR